MTHAGRYARNDMATCRSIDGFPCTCGWDEVESQLLTPKEEP